VLIPANDPFDPVHPHGEATTKPPSRTIRRNEYRGSLAFRRHATEIQAPSRPEAKLRPCRTGIDKGRIEIRSVDPVGLHQVFAEPLEEDILRLSRWNIWRLRPCRSRD